MTPYSVEGTNYNPVFSLSEDDTVNPSRWISLSSEGTNKLDPSAVLDVPFSVSVPSGIAPGGYYAVIFAETTPVNEDGADVSGVSSRNRVGQIVYITVKGDAKQSGSVEMTSIPGFFMGNSYKISYFVKNDGKVHFASKTSVSVTDFMGKVVYSENQDRYVLPDTKRLIEFDWTNMTPVNLYTITRSATLPDGRTVSDSTKMFVVNPFVLVILVILLAATVALFIGRAKSKSRRRMR